SQLGTPSQNRRRGGPTSAAGQLPGVLTAGLDDLESGLRVDVADAEVLGVTDALIVAVRTAVRCGVRRRSEVLELLVEVTRRRGVSRVPVGSCPVPVGFGCASGVLVGRSLALDDRQGSRQVIGADEHIAGLGSLG